MGLGIDRWGNHCRKAGPQMVYTEKTRAANWEKRPELIYFTNSHHHCAVVKDNGPGDKARESEVIAPHGFCRVSEADNDKLHDTRALRRSSGRYKEE